MINISIFEYNAVRFIAVRCSKLKKDRKDLTKEQIKKLALEETAEFYNMTVEKLKEELNLINIRESIRQIEEGNYQERELIEVEDEEEEY
jgi:hypothetical protein